MQGQGIVKPIGNKISDDVWEYVGYGGFFGIIIGGILILIAAISIDNTTNTFNIVLGIGIAFCVIGGVFMVLSTKNEPLVSDNAVKIGDEVTPKEETEALLRLAEQQRNKNE